MTPDRDNFSSALFSTDLAIAPLVPSTGIQPGLADPLMLQGQAASALPHEVIIIDTSVQNYQQLVAGADPAAQVLLLDSTQDGITQITNFLAGQSGISGLHIITHGSAGSLQLGNSTLNIQTLNAYASSLQQWATSFTTGADILLYACNVASNDLGLGFVQSLGLLTGADIAASNDLTGSAALGGDWDFEVNTGAIATDLALGADAIAHYSNVFATIADPQRTALSGGLQQLVNWANTTVDAANALAQALPIVLDTSDPNNPVSATLAQVIDLSTLLTDKILNPASTYLASGNDTEALKNILDALPGISVTDVSAGGEVRFKVQLQTTDTRNLAFDLGRNADLYSLNLSAETLALTRSLDFNFSFGVDAANQFFIRVNEPGDGLTIRADIAETNLTLQGEVGFLGVGINNGSVTLDADVAVNFANPDGDAAGHITIAELSAVTLTPSGSLNAQLPVSVSGGFFTPTGTPTITLTANPFDAGVQPVAGTEDRRTAPAIALTDFSSLLDFANITPQAVKGLLEQLSGSLGDLSDASVFETAIPFTDGKTLGDVLDLEDAFKAKLINLLVNNNGTPDNFSDDTLNFKTAQQLNSILSTITNGALTYDSLTKELRYQVAFSHNFTAVSNPVTLGQNLGPLGNVNVGANSATLSGNVALDLDFGFDLAPDSGPVSLAGRLQASGEPNPGQALTPTNGQLAGNAQFALTIGNNLPINVIVAADATNTSIDDLIADIQAAINAAIAGAGLAGVAIAVGRVGNRISLSTSDAALLRVNIADSTNAAVTQLGLQDNQIARARANTLFIDNASVNGGISFAIADIDASANFGFLAIATNNGSGNVTGNLAVSLSDPGTVANDGRIDLKELFDTLTNPAQLSNLVTTPNVTGSANLSLGGVQVTPDIFNLNSSLGASPAIVISLSDIDDLSTLTVTPNADAAALLNFDNLTFAGITAGFDAIANYLQSLDVPFLNDPLPLINRSLGSLVNYLDRFQGAISDLKTNPAGAIQFLQQRIREALGLPSNSPAVSLSLDGGNVLKLSLELGVGFSGALPVDFQLGGGLANLTGAADLATAANAILHLDFGIDLNTPSNVFLYDTTQLRFDAKASGTNLNFTGAVGPIGLSIVNGSAVLDADGNPATPDPIALVIDLPDDAGDHRYTLAELTGLSLQKSLTGQLSTLLPVYFPTSSNYLGNIQFTVGDLNNIVGTTSISTPDLASLISNFSLLDNIGLIVDGLDYLLSSLQNVLDNQVFNQNLPLIGDKLADGAQFIENFRTKVVNQIQQAIDTAPQMAGSIIQQALFDAFGPAGLGLLLDGSDLGSDISLSDIIMVASADNLDWQMKLGSALQPVNVPLDFDIGLPGLGLEVNGGVQLNLGWDFDFGFGLSRTNGFYFDTADADELNVSFTVDVLPPGTAKGTLGFLQLDVVDQGSGFDGSFTIDFTDPGGDGILTLSEFGGLGVNSSLGAQADIDLDLTASFGGNAAFPSIEADFLFGWGFGSQVDALHPSSPLLQFNNVRMDMGEFLSDFVAPILEQVQDVLSPFNKKLIGNKSILELLQDPIPVISDLAGQPISLLDLASIAGGFVDPGTAKFIDAAIAIIQLVDAIGSIPINNDTVELQFGSFSVGGDQLFNNVGGTNALNITGSSLFSGNWKDQISGTAFGSSDFGSKFLTEANKSDDAGKLAFPFLENPMQVFGLLLGKPATLITYDLPPLGVAFSYSQYFPIWGPLGARITGKVGVEADFAFGYDTVGLQKFAANNFRTPLDIFRGFYVSDRLNADGTGEDVPEIEFDASLAAGVELNAVVASAGVAGGLFAEIDIDLDDPDNDGKVRLEELLNNYLLGVDHFESSGDPLKYLLGTLGMFDTTGRLTAKLFAYIEALFGVYRKEFNITPEITLLEFTIDIPKPPVLATLVDEDSGILRLNMGPYAGDRLHGDTSDHAEHFVVVQGSAPDTVLVYAPSLGIGLDKAQEYKGVKHILADGGAESDRIDLSGVTNAAITAALLGGFGDDTLTAGAGQATLQGGSGDDELTGSNSNDVIFGNAGNDKIDGRGGSDRLFGDNGSIAANRYIRGVAAAEDGNDIITGGDGNDIIFGGGGADKIGGDLAWDVLDGGVAASSNDVIFGDGGRIVLNGDTPDFTQISATEQGVGSHDIIRAHSGDDRVYGGAGNDTIDAGANNDTVFGELGNDLIDGQSGHDVISGGAGDDTIQGGIGNDSILGDNGSDLLNGGADNDTVRGGRGADTIFGEAGRDFLYGDSDGDLMFGGAGNDYMEGNAGNDIMLGELDNDELYGGAGDDVAFGDFGEVEMNLDGDPFTRDRVRSTNPDQGGNDSIYGGIGADLLFGGAFDDDVFGNEDEDIVFGDNGQVNFNGSKLAGIETTSPAIGGNDNLGGGADNDFVLGGAGNDAMTGEAGDDILVGDNGQISFIDGVVSRLETTDPTIGGNDTISGGTEADIAFGGTGNDAIDGGLDAADDILFGDNGVAVQADGSAQANDLFSTDPAFGGQDAIAGGAGNDTIIGGSGGSDTTGIGGDQLLGGADEDLIVGDNAYITRDVDNLVERVETRFPNFGGDDLIDGNLGADIALGGTGNDTITGGNDNADDILLGDNGVVVRADGSAQANDIFSTDPTFGGRDSITGGAGDDTVIGGSGGTDSAGVGGDTLSGGTGNDVVIGDNAYLTRNSGDVIQKIETIFPNQGGDDAIAGDDDDDVLLGGFGADAIAGNQGDDTILGDNGFLDYSLDDDLNTLDLVATTDSALGGSDTIQGNDGNDIAFGGAANDLMTAGLGDDVFLGDNGQIRFIADVTAIETLSPAIGGNDTIHGNEGNDIALGGAADDRITGDLGQDTLLGDNGQVYLTNGQMRLIQTADPGIGGNDTINGNADNDIILGGAADDHLYGDRGQDRILGDNGRLDYAYAGDGTVPADTNLSTLDFFTTTDPTLGGNDQIWGGLGDDTALGGTGRDTIYGDEGVDTLDASWLLAATGDLDGDGETDLLWRNLETGEVLVWMMQNGQAIAAHALPEIADLNWAIEATGDFNGDGKADIIWRNESLGLTGVWFMNGPSSVGAITLEPPVSAGWSIQGTADFNGDGHTDILWRSESAGLTGVWFMNGTTSIGSAAINPAVGAGWNIEGIADFNGDGHADLLWRNESLGLTGVWFMNGTTSIDNAAIAPPVSAGWSVRGTGNFNGDAQPDLIWQYRPTGVVGVWGMNGVNLATSATVNPSATAALDAYLGANGQIVGMGDFNGDGQLDVLWRNPQRGSTVIALMNGAAVVDLVPLAPVTADWAIQGVADFNGDGHTDILWRNESAGLTGVWLMNGTTPIGSAAIAPAVSAGWNVQGVADFNGDGHADLLWRNESAGLTGVWFMNGTTSIGSAAIAPAVGAGWNVQGVADFNGDGYVDLLWRSESAGLTGVWFMNGTTSIGSAAIAPAVSAGWNVHAVGDLNADAQPDLIWQNPSIGAAGVWLMNGMSYAQATALQTGLTANDVLLGDHGKVYEALPARENFYSIDTGASDGGGDDLIYGNQGDDFIQGQQGNDRLFGESGEDDMLGGHNVAAGADGNDTMDGGANPDVMLGDNGMITRRSLGYNEWQRYPAPFNAVIRDLVRFDDRDRIGGDDSMRGGAADDIMHGQRGNDWMQGNAGDDEMYGELGNDTMSGGQGQDVMLGDVGIINRAYNPDGTPRLNADGSWHRDVLLTDVGSVTESLDAYAIPSSDRFQTTDLMLLSGAYDANGNKVPNPVDLSWKTEVQYISLFSDGNDLMTGDDGNDLMFGQRGDDVMGGGNGTDYMEGNAGSDQMNGDAGDDFILGDNGSNLAPFNTELPTVTRGLHLIEQGGGVNLNLGLYGTIVIPNASVVPKMTAGLLPTLSFAPPVQRDHSPMPPIGAIAATDGTFRLPLVSVVPDLLHHLDLIASNDAINGGAGADMIVGDDYANFMPFRTGNAAVDAQMDQTSRSLHQLIYDLHDLELALSQNTPGSVVTIGGDILSGGEDGDTILGDNGVFFGPVAAPPVGSLSAWLADVGVVVSRFSGLVNGLLLPFGGGVSSAQPFTLSLGNDSISGDGGNDQLFADDQITIAPALNALPYQPGSFYPFSIAGSNHPGRANFRDFDLFLGNDQVTGGAGDDVMVGGYATQIVPLVTAPTGDRVALQQSLDLLAADVESFLRDLYEDRHGINYTNRDRSNLLVAANDSLMGDSGSDLMIGDNVTLTIPIVNGAPDLGIPLNQGNFDVGDQSHNFFHALPHQYDTLNRNLDAILFGRDAMFGGDDNDLMFALRGIDQVFGDNGDDYLFGGEEADTLNGGLGNNIVRNTNPSPNDLRAIAPPIQLRLNSALSPATRRYILEILASQNLAYTNQFYANFPG